MGRVGLFFMNRVIVMTAMDYATAGNWVNELPTVRGLYHMFM